MQEINRRIFVFWFGDEMSSNRKQCLEEIRANANVPVELITADNLSDWIVEPLHEGFDYIQAVHKSDYLRCYFMLYHGGGYTDIKRMNYDWNPHFDALENSAKVMNGFAQNRKRNLTMRLPDIRNNPAIRNRMIGFASFIFKAHSDFCMAWMNEIHRILDANMETLKTMPTPGHRDRAEENPEYPIRWAQLGSESFHAIMVYHLHQIMQTLPQVNTDDYL